MTTRCVGKVISEAYELEYGKDCLEMHVGAVQQGEKAVVIDDLVATGGTISAAIKLLGEFSFLRWYSNIFHASQIMVFCLGVFQECVGAQVVECACVIGVPELIKVTLGPNHVLCC